MTIRTSIPRAALVFAMLPLAASAQVFVATSQTASASAYASGGEAVSKSETGTLAPISLYVASGSFSDTTTQANGGASSVINGYQIGIRAGAGVNIPSPSNGGSYPGGYSGGYGGGYGGSYGGDYGANSGSGSAAGSISLGFRVTEDVDVRVDVTDLYANVGSQFGMSSTVGLYKLDGDRETMFKDRSELAGLTHLSAGDYKLAAAFTYADHTYNGLAGAGATVLITAVPEPASMALMGLGLVGVMLARRRRMPGC